MKKKVIFTVILVVLCVTLCFLTACIKDKNDSSDSIGDNQNNNIPSDAEPTDKPSEPDDGVIDEPTNEPTDPDIEHQHSFGEWQDNVKGTCITVGNKIHYCECGFSEIEDTILDENNHANFVSEVIVTEADCMNTGKKEKTCVCGAVVEETIPVATYNHQYLGEWITTFYPTCTQIGHEYSECQCGQRVGKDIPMLNHIPEDTLSSDDTYHYYLCTECSNPIEKIAHTAVNGECECQFILGMHYVLKEDDTYMITDYDGGLEIVNIPEYYRGKKVTEIGEYAFREGYNGEGYGNDKNENTILEINLPNSITKIEYRAFYSCEKLTKVTMSENLEYAGEGIFRACGELEEVTTLGKLTYISDEMFLSCDQLEFVIPESIVSIGRDAFYGCDGFVDLVIPEGVKSIGQHAFFYSTALKSVVLPSTLESVGVYVFEGCNLLEKATFPTVAMDIMPLGSLVEVKINGGEEITAGAFLQNTVLKSITLSNSIKTIGTDAFSGCSSLEEVIYEGDIESWCAINFASATANPTNYSNNLIIDGKTITSINIPSSVTKIGDYAFVNNDAITEITIASELTEIGERAFSGCDNVTTLTASTLALSEINIRKVTTLVINGGESIPQSIFLNCTKLESVTISTSITEIKNSAFAGCTSLTTIIYEGTSEQWEGITKGTRWDFNTGEYTLICLGDEIEQ